MNRFVFCMFILFSTHANSQQKVTLMADQNILPINVIISNEKYLGKESLKVLDTAQGITPELKFAKLVSIPFHNGRIEVEVAGKPLTTAPESARGFVGIAFRINNDNTKFECIYLRPANGRADDQVRRNHSVQYISYPDFPWQKLRKETPEKYEAYVDLEVGVWTNVAIEVKDEVAKLYIHGASQPTLIVHDLKLGPDVSGTIGLWVGSGTEAHFRNLQVTTTP